MKKPTKITLGEFDAFQKSLSDDWYFIDDGLSDEFWDGKFDPAEIVLVGEGDITIAYQGNEELSEDEKYKDFLTEFKKWKNGINFDIVTVKIPKGKKEELLALIKERFGDVK